MAKQLNHLDLFSGIGGFALAAQIVGSIQTQQFCEIDAYAQKVLAKNFPHIPIHDDITTFSAQPGQYDLITGGFPCQDVSSANPNGRGLEDERSGLFYELMRIVCECRPRYVVLENVAALLSKRKGRDMGAVLWHLSEGGYDAEWQVISAASVGAPYLRERVFIVAYRHSKRHYNRRDSRQKRRICADQKRNAAASHSDREQLQPEFREICGITSDGDSVRRWQDSARASERAKAKNSKQSCTNSEISFANGNCKGLEARQYSPDRQVQIRATTGSMWWQIEPPILRVDDGFSGRVDRIRGLGNAVVPQVAAIALRRVLEINHQSSKPSYDKPYPAAAY
ncbi:MAG: DNA cytosine methyltransferase [Cyanobacteria bacterium P01_C01_bin.120]